MNQALGAESKSELEDLMPLRIIKRWGDSPAVRIPMAVMKDAGLNLEQAVQVRAERGCIIIEPTSPALDDLFHGIAAEGRRAAEERGQAISPVGA